MQTQQMQLTDIGAQDGNGGGGSAQDGNGGGDIAQDGNGGDSGGGSAQDNQDSNGGGSGGDSGGGSAATAMVAMVDGNDGRCGGRLVGGGNDYVDACLELVIAWVATGLIDCVESKSARRKFGSYQLRCGRLHLFAPGCLAEPGGAFIVSCAIYRLAEMIKLFDQLEEFMDLRRFWLRCGL